jgi:DNA-binding IclR family transcriptional regulator
VSAGSLASAWRSADAEVDADAGRIDAADRQRYPHLDASWLRAKVEEFSRDGHVLMLDVIVQHMGGPATPITGADGRTIAALSIAG